MSYCPLFIFILEFSPKHISKTTSNDYEILWVNRSHQGGAQCSWTITLACLIFEILPFVYFLTLILSCAYLQNYTSYGYEVLWVVTTWGKTGVSWDNLPLLFHSVFYPFGELSAIFMKFEIVVCKLFQLWRV